MRCQLFVACLPNVLGVICAAAVAILHHASALDPPRFQVSALPQSVYQYGTYDGNVLTTASMGCIASVTNITFFQSRWFSMKRDGGESELNSSDDRIMIRNGFIIIVDHIGTNAIIDRLSYADNGTYRCEIQENDVTSQPISEWVSATIELMLNVRLQPVDNVGIIHTFNDSKFVELACDMSGYIHPDDDLYWIAKGVSLSLSTNDGLKYSVSYRNGVNVAQFGGYNTVPSRVSVLTVLDVALADSGTYSCAINNTDLAKQVVLNVIAASKPSGHPQSVKAKSVSSTSIEVSWEEIPAMERNGNVTHYEIHYSVGDNMNSFEPPPTIVVTTDGPVLNARLQGLEEYTLYNISVRGVTIVGSGPYSPPVMDQTWEDLPSASPGNLMIVSVDKDALQVTWERPEEIDINGVLRLYRIEYCGPIRDGGNLLRSTCTQMDVNGSTYGVVLSSLKESSTYNVSVAAFTIGTGPTAWKLAQTRSLQLPLQPSSEPLIIGVVIGVLLVVFVVVLVASIVIGFIITDKFSRNQPKRIKSVADGTQVPSVTEVPLEDLPSPNLLPASTDSEAGVTDEANESSSISVGEELTDPITFRDSSESDQATTPIITGVSTGQEPSDVNLQPKLTLLNDESPQYSLFESTSGNEELPHAKVSPGKLNFDANSDYTAKEEDDINLSCATVKEQTSDVKCDLLELLQPRAADGED